MALFLFLPQVHNGFLRAGVEKLLAVATTTVLEGGREGPRNDAPKVGERLEENICLRRRLNMGPQ